MANMSIKNIYAAKIIYCLSHSDSVFCMFEHIFSCFCSNQLTK